MSSLSPEDEHQQSRRNRWPDWLPEANSDLHHEREAALRHAPWDESDLDRNDPDPEIQAFIAHVDRTTRIHNALTFEGQMNLFTTTSVAGHRSGLQVWLIRLIGFLVLLGFAVAFLARLF